MQSDFDWLVNAGVAIPVKRVSEAIYPLEAKSGKHSTRHAALDNLLRVRNYDFAEAPVLHKENLKKHEALACLPIYMVSFSISDEMI